MPVDTGVSTARAAVAVATLALLTTGFAPLTARADDLPTPVPTILPAFPTPAAPGATAPGTAAPLDSAPSPSPRPVPPAGVSPVPRRPQAKGPAASSRYKRAGPGNALYAPLRYFPNTKWACETFDGVNETHVYVNKGPYVFVLHNIVRYPGGPVELQETYAFDWPRGAWKAAVDPGPYRLRARLLGDNDWIFEGSRIERGVAHPIRMRYHMYDDVIFRRDFEALRAGTWTPVWGETCERNDFADVKM